MKKYTVATILSNNSKEIYGAVDKVKCKADLPMVTAVVKKVLDDNKEAIRDLVAAKKCVDYLALCENKTIAGYTGTLVTFMTGSKI